MRVLWAALEGIAEGAVWHDVRSILFTENWEGPEGFHPYLYVDAAEYRDAWREAVQAYELFRGGVSSFDYVSYYDGLGQVRGAQWARRGHRPLASGPGRSGKRAPRL